MAAFYVARQAEKLHAIDRNSQHGVTGRIRRTPRVPKEVQEVARGQAVDQDLLDTVHVEGLTFFLVGAIEDQRQECVLLGTGVIRKNRADARPKFPEVHDTLLHDMGVPPWYRRSMGCTGEQVPERQAFLDPLAQNILRQRLSAALTLG